MPLYPLPDKRKRKYEYKVHAVTIIEEDLLNNMAQQWYELDYSIPMQQQNVIYLVFRRYTYND